MATAVRFVEKPLRERLSGLHVNASDISPASGRSSLNAKRRAGGNGRAPGNVTSVEIRSRETTVGATAGGGVSSSIRTRTYSPGPVFALYSKERAVSRSGASMTPFADVPHLPE